MNSILEKSFYQSFDFIDNKIKASNSGEKYKSSRLEGFELLGQKVLDVGCNAGYFLFRLLDKNPSKMLGVDAGENFIFIANEINKKYFNSPIIQFIKGDFFEINFTEKFDLIICFSTFHYFLDNQNRFLKDCYFLLNSKGILLLEMEEYPDSNIFPHVNKAIRPADGKSYHYPNQAMLEAWIKNLFTIEDRYISTKQGGSLYDRYFYKLRKNR